MIVFLCVGGGGKKQINYTIMNNNKHLYYISADVRRAVPTVRTAEQ